MATITPSNTSGGAVAFTAASAGGDTVALGSASRPVILVNNASGASVTVTLTAVNACSQNFLHNQSAACPAGTITEIVPNGAVIDATPANRGNVLLAYSATTSVTVGAVAS
jgi:hypothetical protein